MGATVSGPETVAHGGQSPQFEESISPGRRPGSVETPGVGGYRGVGGRAGARASRGRPPSKGSLKGRRTMATATAIRSQMYIDGRWTDADGGTTLAVINPADES